MSKKEFTFIDLFAGIGGMRLAFEKWGGTCVFSSEWDKFSQQTYEANFHEIPEGDITQISSSKIPKHDILLGGFPCQPFSHAGLKEGFADTRGTLFFEVERIIKAKKPSLVLLENVKGFVSHDKGRTLATVEEKLTNLGYKVYWKVLNASDFGLPQNRERVFIVGINSRKIKNAEFVFPKATKKQVCVGDILEKNPKETKKYEISNKLWKGHQRRLREHRARGNGFGYSLFEPDSVRTSTISARYYKDGSEILIETDGNPRKITPREAARLQGFPEKFIIPVSDTQAYRQFGNAVAVKVVLEIAREMVKLLPRP